MNTDIIKGKWTQLKGKAQAKWGDLTDDDFKVAEGNAEYLSGRLQERYGIARDEADKQVKEFDASLRKDYPDYK
ncbi:CsbD family protein [Stenotrophomonas tumulicola]|uniref:CsbD family protein n=1 Tax=Stenotrophomonas tumulicola TaxID=1685415 RepID=A0A7W3FPV5_9GAMM|nr:CsbD family protein [Stenotrophomonas tumulicola]MBA8683493.1 CsbD family protein [Stenotrophomonas tumulicola]